MPRTVHKVLICLAIAGQAASASGQEGEAVNQVLGIDVRDEASGSQIRVLGSDSPTFSVYRLEHPPRLFVDFSNSELAGDVTNWSVRNGLVDDILVLQYRDDVSLVTRVVIALESEQSEYDVSTADNDVLITVSAPGWSPAPRVADANEAAEDTAATRQRLARLQEEAARSQELLSQRNERLAGLQTEVQRVTSLELEQRRRAEDLSGELAAAEVELSDARTSEAQANAQLEAASQRADALEQQLAELGRLAGERDLLADEVAERGRARRQLEDELQAIDAERSHLAADVETATQTRQQLEQDTTEAQSRLAEAQSRLAEAAEARESAEAAARQARSELAEVEARLAASRDEYGQVEHRLEEAIQERSAIEAELAAADQRRSSVSAELEAATRQREALNAELAQTRAAREALDLELSEAARERERLDADLASTIAERERVQAELEEAAREREQIHADVEDAVRERQRLSAELETLTEDQRQESAALEETRSERVALEDTIDGLETRRRLAEAGLESVEAQREETERRLAELEATRDRLNTEIGAADLERDELSQLEAERDRVNRELETAQAARDAERQQVAQLQAERERLSTELEATRQGWQSQRQQVAELQAERQRLAEELETERLRLGAELEAERERLMRQLDAAQNDRLAEHDQLEAMERERDRLTQQIEAADAARQTELARLERERTQAQSSLGEMERQREALAAEVEAMESRLAQLRAQVETVQDERAAPPPASPAEPATASVAPATPDTIDTPSAETLPAANLVDIRFEQLGGVDRIVLEFDGAAPEVESLPWRDGRAGLVVPAVSLPENLRRTLDTRAFGGPVQFISTFTDESGDVRLMAELAEAASEILSRDGRMATWEFGGIRDDVAQASPEGPGPGDLEGYNSQEEPTTPPPIRRPEALSYTIGERRQELDTPRLSRRFRVTIDVVNADIQNVLRLFSDQGDVNIIASGRVGGTITLRLRDVPLDQAFALILQSQGLGFEQRGNIIRVAPIEEFQEERQRELDRVAQAFDVEPLQVRLRPVSYADGGQMISLLGDVLSSRGTATFDPRTHTLILTDVSANLDAAEQLIDALDTQTPQVLIEARIVQTSETYSTGFGIQWGGDAFFSAETGNATGLYFPSTIGIAGGAGQSPNAGTSSTPNYAVNLPGPSAGAIGFQFGSLGQAVNLNLRLSAAESTGEAKVVSAPRILTLDGQSASISTGVSIPVQTVGAAGTNVSFIQANLSLNVTPTVTPDAFVHLELNITKNEPDFARRGANNDPSIITRTAQTSLLVRDGETSVIGGIFEHNQGMEQTAVPFFADIPILGALFHDYSFQDERTETLVFITPRIVNRDVSLVSYTPGGVLMTPPDSE